MLLPQFIPPFTMLPLVTVFISVSSSAEADPDVNVLFLSRLSLLSSKHFTGFYNPSGIDRLPLCSWSPNIYINQCGVTVSLAA